MIELTEQQAQALLYSKKPLRLVNPQTRETFVLLGVAEYARLTGDQTECNSGRGQGEYDDSPWTDEERDLLRAEAIETLGWEGMQAYQEEL